MDTNATNAEDLQLPARGTEISRPPSIPRSAVEGLPLPSPEVEVGHLCPPNAPQSGVGTPARTAVKRKLERSPNDSWLSCGDSPRVEVETPSMPVVISDDSGNETVGRSTDLSNVKRAISHSSSGPSSSAG